MVPDDENRRGVGEPTPPFFSFFGCVRPSIIKVQYSKGGVIGALFSEAQNEVVGSTEFLSNYGSVYSCFIQQCGTKFTGTVGHRRSMWVRISLDSRVGT